MRHVSEAMTRVAECQRKAKSAENADDKESWLALADSWRQTAELTEPVEREAQFVFNAMAKTKNSKISELTGPPG